MFTDTKNPPFFKKGVENVTCLEYVIDNIPKKNKKEVEDKIINHDYINKQNISIGTKVIFVQNFHIGFAELCDDYGTLKTDEYSDNEHLCRFLPLFDESLHIVYKL